MSTRNPTGIIVQSTPANQTAYSGQPHPQDQVSFAASIEYSDGSVSGPIGGVQWSNGDSCGFLCREMLLLAHRPRQCSFLDPFCLL